MRRDHCDRFGVLATRGFVSLPLVAALLLLPSLTMPAQEENGGSEEDGTKNFEYEPYTQEEFPQWAHDLRRFETILIGSIPITFFFANIGFDTAAYVANDYDQNYLPLFFGSSPEKDELRYDTRMDRLAVSLSLSAAIAFIDYFLGRLGEE